MIAVEVVYAHPGRQFLHAVKLDAGATVKQAIVNSGVLSDFPELSLETVSAGVFGRKVALDYRLSEGDRVEIYRPLVIDPKEARRHRARLKKTTSV